MWVSDRLGRVGRPLVAIVLVGFALRLFWWWFAHPGATSDYAGYRAMATRLYLHGEYTRNGVVTAWRAPGYVLFLVAGMVVSRAGGPGGGATTLTEECRQLLAFYRDLRRTLDEDLMRAWEAPPQRAEAGD